MDPGFAHNMIPIGTGRDEREPPHPTRDAERGLR
jgi:hypothetical protein